jgi:hypothetical protein
MLTCRFGFLCHQLQLNINIRSKFLSVVDDEDVLFFFG